MSKLVNGRRGHEIYVYTQLSTFKSAYSASQETINTKPSPVLPNQALGVVCSLSSIDPALYPAAAGSASTYSHSTPASPPRTEIPVISRTPRVPPHPGQISLPHVPHVHRLLDGGLAERIRLRAAVAGVEFGDCAGHKEREARAYDDEDDDCVDGDAHFGQI